VIGIGIVPAVARIVVIVVSIGMIGLALIAVIIERIVPPTPDPGLIIGSIAIGAHRGWISSNPRLAESPLKHPLCRCLSRPHL